MQLPREPGIYVVELLNDEPLSVNADRAAIADRCIKVNRENCKYGRAKNLARRQRDYARTFGEQNVRFRYFAVTEHYAAIEAEIGKRLLHHRMPGETGRLNEWLKGISPEAVEQIVKAAVAAAETTSLSAAPPVVERLSTSNKSVVASVSPTQLVEAAQYLDSQGMPISLLRDLHHSPRRDETYKSTCRYFKEKLSLLENNIAYGSRLVYVAEQHRATGGSFIALVAEALRLHLR